MADVASKVIPIEHAKRLYDKLSPFLRVEKGEGNPVAEPYGCYPPPRHERQSLRDWPLHHWRGPGHSPLCLSWCPNSDRRPTFDQFLCVYGLRAVIGADLPTDDYARVQRAIDARVAG